MRRILSVDPGAHVGIAVAEIEEDGTVGFFSYEMTPEQFYDMAEALVYEADVVLCEDFVISGARARDSNQTIEMIGVLRYLVARRNQQMGYRGTESLPPNVPFITQPPGAGTAFAGPKWSKLKAIGWYRPGPDHSNSAAGHLLRYLVQNPALREQLLPLDAALEEVAPNANS